MRTDKFESIKEVVAYIKHLEVLATILAGNMAGQHHEASADVIPLVMNGLVELRERLPEFVLPEPEAKPDPAQTVLPLVVDAAAPAPVKP